MYVSIKTHVIVLLIFAALIPFILLRTVAYPIIQSDLKTVIMDNLEIVGHKQGKLVSTWMHERMKDVIVVASNPNVVNSVKITAKAKEHKGTIRYLEIFVAEYGYKGAFISDNNGLITLATREGLVGEDISKMDIFKHAAQGKISASSIIPSKIPLMNEFDENEKGLPTMFVASPLKDDDEAIIGVVILRLNVAILSNLMHSLAYGKTGESYLVNKDAYMLTESRFTNHLKEIGLVEKRSALELKLIEPGTGKLTYGVKQCLAGKVGSDAKGYNDYAGISVLGVWDWIPEFNWGVITEIDRAEAYGPVYNLRYIVLALMLAIAFPFLLAAYFIGRRFSSPIIRLKEVAEEITSGDLTKKADIRSDNEIGELATAFNTMTMALHEKTEETAKSEERYREMFESLKEGVYQCEPGVEGMFTWVNEACAEMFGYNSPEEMMGTKVKDIYVDPEDRWRLLEILKKHGIRRNFVSDCKKIDGGHLYTERTTNMIRNEKNEPVLVEGIIRDITERKRMEDELQESVDRDRELFNSLRDSIYQCEPGAEGVFTWVNQACAEMFGYKSPEEMVGTKSKDIYANPEDSWKHLEKLEQFGFLRNFVSNCKKKNRECFSTERTANLIRNKDGDPVTIEGIFKDITEQRNLKTKLKKPEKKQKSKG
ncbi:MAG: PAS domain S-box protein [Candidatus Scalindua sp.]|nr:PAS domain S-box protein [Candidatus Scalindua sp.]MDV5165347.1 PAS domain S-box protein [Candidatus Scalindua sp.]